METLRISFITVDRKFEIKLESPDETTTKLFNDLLYCFADTELESDNTDTISVFAEQLVTKELKDKVSTFVAKYGDTYKLFNKLENVLNKLPDGQYFLVVPSLPTETSDLLRCEQYLALLNSKGLSEDIEKDLIDEQNRTHEVFGEILNNYNISCLDGSSRTAIGNAQRAARTCRFCRKKSEDGVTFKKLAHAIPEALGNKNIVLHDECDGCNSFFGDVIEPALIEYLDIFRSTTGIKGKNGHPTIKFKNGKISNQDGITVISTQNLEKTDTCITATFQSTKTNIPVNIYKALCKITLSTIQTDIVPELYETIKWMLNENSPEVKLPRIASVVLNTKSNLPPQVTNYIRKSNDTSLPHVVTEFKIGQLVYVYIVPFSKKDDKDFVDVKDYDRFWAAFKHYNSVTRWKFSDYSKCTPVHISEKIRVYQR